jgi:hypothetical protein
MFAPPFGHPLGTPSPAPTTTPFGQPAAVVFGSTMMEFSSPFASPMKPPSTPGGASFAVGLASPMVVQSPHAPRHETPKKLVTTMPTSKNARRQRLMETCLRKVKDNRNTLVSTLRAGGLTPASFRSEIGRMVNYEWSAMDNGAGVAPLATMMRQDELEEAEYAETIIALEQAFLDDLRREGTCRPGPCTTSRAERSNAHPPRALSSISQSKAWSINTLMRCDDSRRNRFEVRLHLSPSLLACLHARVHSIEGRGQMADLDIHCAIRRH